MVNTQTIDWFWAMRMKRLAQNGDRKAQIALEEYKNQLKKRGIK